MNNITNKSVLSFPVLFEKQKEFYSSDNRFTKIKIWLMHTGKNLNGSVFEKNVIDDAIETLEYIPVVGFIEQNKIGEEDFSDHRYIITKDENGIKRKYIGTGYGVILSSADNNAHYENRICDDGIEREYLVCDAYIWNMFEDSSNILNRDMIKSQSMELDENSIEGFEDEDGLFHFTKFSFRASCILGQDYEPAMISSTVEVQFSVKDFVKNIQNEITDKYIEFSKVLKDIDIENKLNQGGKDNMPITDFSQTVMEQFSDISTIVKQYESIKDMWGDSVPRYYLKDIQDDEVIVVDRKNNYQYYGFKFSVNGDKPEIDFACGGRKKVRYENYVDGSTEPICAFNFGKHIAEIEKIAFNKVEEAETAKNTAETNYNSIKADYDEMKPKYDNYVMEEEKRHIDELNAKKDEKFSEYEDVLSGNSEFTELKNRKEELSVDEIEKECAVLYVKECRSNSNFSKKHDFSKVNILEDDFDNEGCGYVSTKYGNIPVRR